MRDGSRARTRRRSRHERTRRRTPPRIERSGCRVGPAPGSDTFVRKRVVRILFEDQDALRRQSVELLRTPGLVVRPVTHRFIVAIELVDVVRKIPLRPGNSLDEDRQARPLRGTMIQRRTGAEPLRKFREKRMPCSGFSYSSAAQERIMSMTRRALFERFASFGNHACWSASRFFVGSLPTMRPCASVTSIPRVSSRRTSSLPHGSLATAARPIRVSNGP